MLANSDRSCCHSSSFFKSASESVDEREAGNAVGPGHPDGTSSGDLTPKSPSSAEDGTKAGGAPRRGTEGAATSCELVVVVVAEVAGVEYPLTLGLALERELREGQMAVPINPFSD